MDFRRATQKVVEFSEGFKKNNELHGFSMYFYPGVEYISIYFDLYL